MEEILNQMSNDKYYKFARELIQKLVDVNNNHIDKNLLANYYSKLTKNNSEEIYELILKHKDNAHRVMRREIMWTQVKIGALILLLGIILVGFSIILKYMKFRKKYINNIQILGGVFAMFGLCFLCAIGH